MPPKKRVPAYNPFDRGGQESKTDGPIAPTIEEVDARVYGRIDLVGVGQQVANEIAIDLITPDLAQPRKAIPSSVRRAARQEGIPEWQAWHRIAEQLHGSKIDLPRLLKGEGEASETEPLGIPLVDAFMDLVGLAATIYRDGQTNAITVVRIPGPQERYQIETGERRWQSHLMLSGALEEAQFKKIKARVVDKANVWRQATENNARRPLNAIGIARQLALLMMDLYRGKDGISILAYGQMVQDGECDRKFYAQVSNGNIYRIPKGLSERILQATGLKSRSQIAHYRSLLDIPDDVWTTADEDDWPEFRIREYVKPPAPQQDTFTPVNVSPQNGNPSIQSTQQKESPNPFGRPSSLPSTDGMGTQATGPKMMYMGATVEYVRIEETDNGTQAIIWTISPNGTRMMQRRVDPGELKDLPSASQRRMNGPVDRSEPPADHWIKIGLPVVHEMNGYRYEGTIKHAEWDSGMNEYMVKILTSAGKTEGPFESKNLQVNRTQVIAGENYKHRGGRLYHVTGLALNDRAQVYEIYPDGKRKGSITETVLASDLTPLKPAAPAPQPQAAISPFKNIYQKIYQHRRTGILYRVKETHKDGSVSAIAVNEAGEDISKYTQSIDVTELKTYKPEAPQQPEEDLIAERQEQMLLALYHRQPVVKNAATRQALEEKLMIHVMDREAWDMGITTRGVDYLREHGLIEDEGDARIAPTESAATEAAPSDIAIPAWAEEGITVEHISGRRGVIVSLQMKDQKWEATISNQYGDRDYPLADLRPASFETPFIPPAQPAPQEDVPPEWARFGSVVRHIDTGKICDVVGTLRDDANDMWLLRVDVRGETRADDAVAAFEPLMPEEIAALPTVARERHSALEPKNLTKVITEDQFGLAELETMAAQLRMLDEGKRIMRLKVITPNHLQTFIRENGAEGAYAKVASLYEAGLETLEALEKRKQAMAANLEVVNAEVLEALRQMIAEQQ